MGDFKANASRCLNGMRLEARQRSLTVAALIGVYITVISNSPAVRGVN